MQYEFTSKDFPKQSTLGILQKLWPTPRQGNPGSRPNKKGGRILAEEAKKNGLSPVAFPVRTFRVREREKGSPEAGRVFGLRCGELLGYYDRIGSLLRTLERLLFEGSTECLRTLPRSGTMRSGRIYVQAMWVLRTEGRESGLWPTPDSWSAMENPPMGKEETGKNKHALKLVHAVKMWPTPQAWDSNRGPMKEERYQKKLGGPNLISEITHRGETSGQLNPTWVEWLMGYPSGWTDLNALVTPLYLR